MKLCIYMNIYVCVCIMAALRMVLGRNEKTTTTTTTMMMIMIIIIIIIIIITATTKNKVTLSM